jgi:two-component sensor histidine kinase
VIGFSPFSEYNNQQDYEDVLLAIKGGYKIVDKLIEMKTVDQNSKWVLASYLPLEFHKIPTILGWFYDVTDRTQAERTRLQQVEMQRNALVREVHHRIKNNLQGIIGLLGIVAIQKPNAATAIHDVIGKLKSIAVVFGLQGRNQSDEILLQEVVFELCETARNITDASIVLMPSELICRTIRLDKDKAVAISLVMNELLTNAIKHNSGGVVSVDLRIELEEVVLSIVNPSEPSTLKWEQGVGLGTGLNLVRLMLPQNTSKLSLVLDSGQMTAQLCLVSPTVYF